MTEINKRFKIIRKKLGLSQNELAEKLDITQITVSRYENEEKQISSDVLERIAHLGINLNWLLLGWGEMFLDQKNSPDQKNNIDGITFLKFLSKVKPDEFEILRLIHNAKLAEKQKKKLKELIAKTIEIIEEGGKLVIMSHE